MAAKVKFEAVVDAAMRETMRHDRIRDEVLHAQVREREREEENNGRMQLSRARFTTAFRAVGFKGAGDYVTGEDL